MNGNSIGQKENSQTVVNVNAGEHSDSISSVVLKKRTDKDGNIRYDWDLKVYHPDNEQLALETEKLNNQLLQYESDGKIEEETENGTVGTQESD